MLLAPIPRSSNSEGMKFKIDVQGARSVSRWYDRPVSVTAVALTRCNLRYR